MLAKREFRVADEYRYNRSEPGRWIVSHLLRYPVLPLIAFVYDNWGFDTLFRILAATALVILIAVACLPKRLPTAEVAA